MMRMVTLAARFGPTVYTASVGSAVLAVLVVGLVVQLAILSIGFVLSTGADFIATKTAIEIESSSKPL